MTAPTRGSSSRRGRRIETPAYGHDLLNPVDQIDATLADAKPEPFWLDDPARPEPRPRLDETTTTDLVVVGGGFCGLWTAIIAKQRQPDRDVVLIEGSRIGWAASGRNGGFVEASLTHGPDNGELHFRDELPVLDRLAGLVVAPHLRDHDDVLSPDSLGQRGDVSHLGPHVVPGVRPVQVLKHRAGQHFQPIFVELLGQLHSIRRQIAIGTQLDPLVARLGYLAQKYLGRHLLRIARKPDSPRVRGGTDRDRG